MSRMEALMEILRLEQEGFRLQGQGKREDAMMAFAEAGDLRRERNLNPHKAHA